jgi:serine/threonine-protein kinase
MGVVFAATHIQLEQRVAVKVMQPEALRAPGAMDRFLREARTVARMRSDHIARVYDVGTLDTGEPYAVMEFLEGQDLSKRLEEKGPMEVADAISLLLQTCEALAEAHALGIVHRDLKPENMFITTSVDRRPFVKVIDFGLAKSLLPADTGTVAQPHVLTRSFTVMGTPVYMSPEQLRSTRDVDLRTDIWSLGIVAYEMLTGRAPFDAASLPDLCASIVRDPVPPMNRPNVPREIEDAILQCLTKEPDDRFAKVGQFAAAIADSSREEDRAILERILRVQPLTRPPPRRQQSNPEPSELGGDRGPVSVADVAGVGPRPWGPRRIVGIAIAGLLVGVVTVSLALSRGKPAAPAGIVGTLGEVPTATPSSTSAPAVSPPSLPVEPSSTASRPGPFGTSDPPAAGSSSSAPPAVSAEPPPRQAHPQAAPVAPPGRVAPRPAPKPTIKDPLETR